ncbi:MAG: L-serine ammonia-lyase, iron-sulfur-dependent, subunit alpha [Oscillospiraceae bacterium]|nr:L-serine ammonia-lyase, iron-sulfur-dependent, subunit alpha [Oscillospiraceae bacterium]
MDALTVIKRCAEEQRTIGGLAFLLEAENDGTAEADVVARVEQMLEVMEKAAVHALEKPVRSVSGLTGGDAFRYRGYQQAGLSLMGELPSLAMAYALSSSETNAAMGRIVACPTAGSCGILPAALFSVAKVKNLPRHKLVDAFLAAGVVGMIIDEHASLAGAQGGCQAECGSAAAMAAAAVTEMLDGTPEQCFNAAAIAIKNTLGLVCDPVAGLVEIPCIKRNVGGVMNALSAADLALAGVQSYIPFDDAVDAMNRVGNAMPAALRETALGGLATTETGKRMMEQVFGERK